MANLSEEERKILEQAREIQDRLEAERLEAGEIELDSDKKRRKKREELKREEQMRQSQMEAERRRQQEARRRQAEMNQRRQAMEQNPQNPGSHRPSQPESGQAQPNPQRAGEHRQNPADHPGQTKGTAAGQASSNKEYWEAAKREVASSREQGARAAGTMSPHRARPLAQNGQENRRPVPQRPAQAQRRRMEEAPAVPKKKKKKKSHAKKIAAVLLTICMILALLFAGAYFIVRAIVSRTNYQPYETEYVRAADVMHDSDVMNVLLIGSDERGSVDTARSDAMIVLSVNENTKKIVMTSILRDSYVNIPGYGMQRINHSYQMGGPALLIQTIEENFKIGIDYYASVDFFAFMDIIDCVDGVEITVTDEEVQWVNAYVAELNGILGDPEGDGYISGAGTLTMTGKQALAYSRIRYVGTDFARTERQRTVLNAVIDKLKSANPIQLFRVVNTVLPDVDTDMDDHAMTMTLFKAITYLGYDIEQFRVPMDGTWWNEDAGGQEVLGMDFAANIAGLQNTIYGE